MAVLKCLECNGTVSEHAEKCPHCGAPDTVFKGANKSNFGAGINHSREQEALAHVENDSQRKRVETFPCPSCNKPVTGSIIHCIHCNADLSDAIEKRKQNILKLSRSGESAESDRKIDAPKKAVGERLAEVKPSVEERAKMVPCQHCGRPTTGRYQNCIHCGKEFTQGAGDDLENSGANASERKRTVDDETLRGEANNYTTEERRNVKTTNRRCENCGTLRVFNTQLCIKCGSTPNSDQDQNEVDGIHGSQARNSDDTQQKASPKEPQDPFEQFDKIKQNEEPNNFSRGIIEDLARKSAPDYEDRERKEAKYQQRQALRGLDRIKFNFSIFASWFACFAILNFISSQIVIESTWITADYARLTSNLPFLLIMTILVVSTVQAYSRIALSFVPNQSRAILVNALAIFIGYATVHVIYQNSYVLEDMLYETLQRKRSLSEIRQTIEAFYVIAGVVFPVVFTAILSVIVQLKHVFKGEL